MRGLGLLFVIMLICGPVVQSWYVLWAVLPLAASARLPKQRLRLAVTSAVIALALPPIGASAGVLVCGYAGAAVLVTAGWWWLHRRVTSVPGEEAAMSSSDTSPRPRKLRNHCYRTEATRPRLAGSGRSGRS